MIVVVVAIILLCHLLLYRHRSFHYLRYFQQEEYNSGRFLSWLWNNRVFDIKATAIALIALIVVGFVPFVGSIVAAVALLFPIILEGDPRITGKITLKMTMRAKRIYLCAFILYATLLCIAAWYVRLHMLWLIQILFFQSIPLLLVIANGVMMPLERIRQRRYVSEAREIVRDVNPVIIGITGSYGKTSTKNILGEILQIAVGTTFWPPKGVNTLMGITREIRENLKRGIDYAVVEMGAYRRGSISRLCGITPPKAGIITAVGLCHLERFGSEEDIFKAKSELAEAIPDNGILVCNGDDPAVRRIAEENHKLVTLLYGFDDNDLDCWVSSMALEGDKGTSFTLHWNDDVYDGYVPMFGKTMLYNVMAAFSMACAFGADPEYVLAVLTNIEPVGNRLQVERNGDIIYIKDAYNSNPIGFCAALDVLEGLLAKRRIIITPGMIELGERRYEENVIVGEVAGAICDLAIVVGDVNSDALRCGLERGGLDDKDIVYCNSRDEGFAYLSSVVKDGDAVLIENDLTDLYEQRVRL